MSRKLSIVFLIPQFVRQFLKILVCLSVSHLFNLFGDLCLLHCPKNNFLRRASLSGCLGSSSQFEFSGFFPWTARLKGCTVFMCSSLFCASDRDVWSGGPVCTRLLRSIIIGYINTENPLRSQAHSIPAHFPLPRKIKRAHHFVYLPTGLMCSSSFSWLF